MARQARERSKTGIYHIMLRGIDKRDIFLEDEDRRKFIKCLLKAKEVGKFEIYAYCLMDNHVHLLMKEGEDIGKTIKRITVSYVIWHNNKYERTGHLFQNRFRSESVEREAYFLTVFRYIHQNPLKAGLISKLDDYQWSSYRQYLHSYKGIESYIDDELIRSYYPNVKDFFSYVNTDNNDECLDYRQVPNYNDKTFRDIIVKHYNVDELFDLPKKERNKLIRKIYFDLGISIRQLSRVLGVGKAIVERAIKEDR